MMTPNAIETKGGNWEPVVVHPERLCPYRNEHFPRHLCRNRKAAIAYAERVIAGRICFDWKERKALDDADNLIMW